LYEVLFRVLSQLEFFYFILSEARQEPEDLPASVGGVAVLLPLVFIIVFCFIFSFTFFDPGLGEGPLRLYRQFCLESLIIRTYLVVELKNYKNVNKL
jgi:hypothetical protein